MKTILLILVMASVLIVGGMWIGRMISHPQAVTVANNPSKAEYEALAARVNNLEDWAVRRGAKFK